jgi:hypothetical protein
MTPLPPPPPRGLPPTGGPGRSPGAGPGRSTLVGGLPWAAPPAVEGAVPGMPVIDEHERREPEPPPVPTTLAGRIEELVRRSPPVTVSVTVHIVALLLLALWIVRGERKDRVVLDLAFLSTEVIEAPDPGVQVLPQPEPVKEPEPEEVKTEEPVVEDPIAP